jgi:hypothetical protein
LEADLVAVASLRNRWELIAANLRQIAAHLAECRNVLQTMSESPEKAQLMSLVAKTAINVHEHLAASMATAGTFEAGKLVAEP